MPPTAWCATLIRGSLTAAVLRISHEKYSLSPETDDNARVGRTMGYSLILEECNQLLTGYTAAPEPD